MAMKKDNPRDTATYLMKSTEQIAKDRDFQQSVLYIYIYIYTRVCDLGKAAQCTEEKRFQQKGGNLGTKPDWC